ncbi:MAG: hypothetical protein EA398_13070 [Deltaproteobacteria bacterium]|nr:MAG: hypothetical protein EA398_13070 [Deltaproteobacteria bacterium]
MKRMRALVLLGWHFLLHWLSKVTFTYRRGGLPRFRENYDPDGLLPLSPEDRALLASWQRCTACGLCEAVCAEAGLVVEGGRTGPMELMTAGSRDLSEHPVAARAATGDVPGAEEAAALCPMAVPIPEVLGFVRRQADQLADR